MTGQPDGSPSAAPEPAEGCEDTAFSLFMSISSLKTRKEKDEPFTFVFPDWVPIVAKLISKWFVVSVNEFC